MVEVIQIFKAIVVVLLEEKDMGVVLGLQQVVKVIQVVRQVQLPLPKMLVVVVELVELVLTQIVLIILPAVTEELVFLML